jgi:plastocyanin
MNASKFVAALRAACAAALLAVAASVTAAQDAPPASVNISKFVFDAKEITVRPGTKVTWTNHDETPHTVASSDKSFASKGMDTDDKYEHVFDKEGDFPYICTVHPFMTGVVHVRK